MERGSEGARERGMSGRWLRGRRTYAHEEEEDAEDVDDGEESEGEGGDDLAEGRDAAEEADDAEGAQDADDAGVEVLDEEGNDGHGDDEGVHLAPHVGEEGLEPVGEEVDAELHGEDDCESEIELVHEDGETARRPVRIDHLVEVLRLDDGADKVLESGAPAFYMHGRKYGMGEHLPPRSREPLCPETVETRIAVEL